MFALMEMYVNGVATRKVTNITEELCGVSFSKSTVSQLCTGLDPRVRAFNERRFDNVKFPFIMVDAMFIKSRDDERVVSRAALSPINTASVSEQRICKNVLMRKYDGVKG